VVVTVKVFGEIAGGNRDSNPNWHYDKSYVIRSYQFTIVAKMVVTKIVTVLSNQLMATKTVTINWWQ